MIKIHEYEKFLVSFFYNAFQLKKNKIHNY